MTTFVDYAWWQVSPAQLASMGFSGAMRYGNPGNTKSITPQEVANLRAANFDIGIVFEREANRSAQGFGAGNADAGTANAFADSIGYPKDCTLFYAVDFDAFPSQVQPYFDGIGSVAGRPYAPYGGFHVIEGVRYSAPHGWQTAAWSGGLIAAHAGLIQDKFSQNYDSNRVLVADFGQWRSAALPTPTPTTVPVHVLEEGMFTVEPNGQPRNVPIPSWAKFVKPLSNGTNARCVILDGNDKELAVHEKDWYAANVQFTMAIPPGAQCFGATNFGPEQSGQPPAGLEVIFDIA